MKLISYAIIIYLATQVSTYIIADAAIGQVGTAKTQGVANSANTIDNLVRGN